MKVVICQINSKYVHSSLAAWCIKAGIEKYGKHSPAVSVAEGTINEKTELVAERLISQKPDVLGFCCYIWNISYVKGLAAAVKKALPCCTVVFGGPEVSYNAKEVLTLCPFADLVVSGEGEYPMARLCDCIAEGVLPEGDGICYIRDGVCRISDPYISCEEPPSPYCEEYFKTLGGRIAYFETSRGCPYSCAFCLSGRCGGVRYFDLDRIKKELILLANSGSQTVKFVDRTFNANKKRAKDIVSFICDSYGRDIPWGVCFHFEIAADILDDEMITLFASAPKGSIQLEIGMQSFNETTLAYINRKTNCDRLKKNISRLIDARNIHIHIDLIAGLPFEDMESFKKSFNTAYHLNADMLQLGFLKLLHGADMRELSEKYPCSYSSEPPYEVISTPWMTAEELDRLRRVEDAVERIYNSGRFRNTLEYVEGIGLSPFGIFETVAESLSETANISLDDYTEKLFDIFKGLDGARADILRDIMLCDRIAAVADGKIPKFFRVDDPFLKTAKHFLEKSPATRRKDGVKRTVALLYGERAVVWCDHTSPDPVTGRYELHKIPFDDVIKYSD